MGERVQGTNQGTRDPETNSQNDMMQLFHYKLLVGYCDQIIYPPWNSHFFGKSCGGFNSFEK